MRREQRPLTNRELERVTSPRPVLRKVKRVREESLDGHSKAPGEARPTKGGRAGPRGHRGRPEQID